MKCSGNTRVVPWLDSGLQMLWPLSSPAWRTKISSHAAWPKTKNNISGPKSDTNYEANDTHRRLSLSSPEKAPFMSSMVQEISLFFRSLVKKERYWNWHQICNKRYRLFSFFFFNQSGPDETGCHLCNYLQLHWAGLRCYVWASSRVCGLQRLWLTGSAALWHVKTARTRDQTSVSCIPRRVLNHCVTREASAIRDRLRKLRSCDF